MFKIPLFQLPSTIVFVDDSPLFLDCLRFMDGLDVNNIKTYTSPLACLADFQNYQSILMKSSFLSSLDDVEKLDLVSHSPVNIDFTKLKKILKSEKVENNISVLIVDYNMPEMKGVELCKKLAHLPFKKILLTGALADNQVVSAFNEGIIDCYIRKNSENLVREINMYVKLLTEKLYTEKSIELLPNFEFSNKLHFSDSAFAEFFNQWCDDNKIIKYCIIDKFGNLRVESKDGKILNFVIYSESTLSEYVTLSGIVNEDNEFLRLIRSEKLIPFFGEQVDEWDIELRDWRKYLYSYNVINGSEEYFWCVVDSI